MTCPQCNSENTIKNGKDKLTRKQKFICNDCGKNFYEETSGDKIVKPKLGITLDEFREKHDVEFIITKTLAKLDRLMIYEKADLIKLSGLSYGAQGLSTILESKTDYYGKTGGKIYYSHPDTIKMLKEQAKLN